LLIASICSDVTVSRLGISSYRFKFLIVSIAFP
jgi:hypothetical protein